MQETLGKKVTTEAKKIVKDKLGRVLLGPLNEIVDESLTDVTTTIGSFVIKSIRDKFQRSITFEIGNNYSDAWMEEALYGILYLYNPIKTKSNLELTNARGYGDGSGLYYRLGDGSHNLRYRNYNIILMIKSKTTNPTMGRSFTQREYMIMTYDLDPAFVINFERDMMFHRNSMLKIKRDSPTINLYKDYHESDGDTYWEKLTPIHKRGLETIYLPNEQKALLVKTLNSFFSKRDYYKKHGVAWNLKILLHGIQGGGKDSIAKMIASEWNRNIYYVTGGKGGKFVPHAITSDCDVVQSPLFLVSDIDKYPFLINDIDINMEEKESGKGEKVDYKQCFGQMINALDGVTSGEDRIIVMTTNHYEKFSPVFLRKGRVDLILEIGSVTVDVFRKYVYDWYGEILPKNIKLINPKLTVADLQFDLVFMELKAQEFIHKHCKY